MSRTICRKAILSVLVLSLSVLSVAERAAAQSAPLSVSDQGAASPTLPPAEFFPVPTSSDSHGSSSLLLTDDAPACEAQMCEWDDGPWKLFPSGPCGWEVTGWVAFGATTNPDNPRNPADGVGNLPTTFNYRNDSFMLNQLYAVLSREADNGGCGWAWGGRIDVLYGEDYLFTQAAGLETRDDFTNRWNSAENSGGIGGVGRLGLALPQAYAEIAYNNLQVKLGHFYTFLGYEVVQAPGNFFYSHAFTHQYGEPFTHTGVQTMWAMNELWSLYGGVVNGWDKFDAESDRPAMMAGATYRPAHGRYALSFGLITGDEDGSLVPFDGNRTMYSVVFDWQVNDRWRSVLVHDLGVQQNNGGGGDDAEWYSLYHYLYRDINECLRAGARLGWFNDDDGARVFPGIPGHHYEATVGLNWKPTRNITLRPEVRWNEFDAHAGIPPGIGPYSGNGLPGVLGNLFNLNHQLLFACDVVVTW